MLGLGHGQGCNTDGWVALLVDVCKLYVGGWSQPTPKHTHIVYTHNCRYNLHSLSNKSTDKVSTLTHTHTHTHTLTQVTHPFNHNVEFEGFQRLPLQLWSTADLLSFLFFWVTYNLKHMWLCGNEWVIYFELLTCQCLGALSLVLQNSGFGGSELIWQHVSLGWSKCFHFFVCRHDVKTAYIIVLMIELATLWSLQLHWIYNGCKHCIFLLKDKATKGFMNALHNIFDHIQKSFNRVFCRQIGHFMRQNGKPFNCHSKFV